MDFWVVVLCSVHFPPIVSTGSHLKPFYPYPSSYSAHIYVPFTITIHFNLKMEAAYSSRSTVSYLITTQHHNPEDNLDPIQINSNYMAAKLSNTLKNLLHRRCTFFT
jgi:hypothetical protein